MVTSNSCYHSAALSAGKEASFSRRISLLICLLLSAQERCVLSMCRRAFEKREERAGKKGKRVRESAWGRRRREREKEEGKKKSQETPWRGWRRAGGLGNTQGQPRTPALAEKKKKKLSSTTREFVERS